MSDIVKRIRSRPNDAPMPTERLLDDAADHIDSLTTERDTLIAANERLRRALEPFALQADSHSEKMPDEMFIDDYERDKTKPWVSLANIRVGDLRRARAALAAFAEMETKP